jgi:hypothetical protein
MELEGWDFPVAAYIASLCQFQLISLPSHYGRGWLYPQLGLPSTSARSTTARQGQQTERKRRECPSPQAVRLTSQRLARLKGHSLYLFLRSSLTVWSLLAQLWAGEGAPSLFPVPAERGQGLPHPQLRKWHRPSASHFRTNTRNVQMDLSHLFLIYSYQQKNGELLEHLLLTELTALY